MTWLISAVRGVFSLNQMEVLEMENRVKEMVNAYDRVISKTDR